MRVITTDPYNDEARHNLDELRNEADVPSLHASITDETIEMVDTKQLRTLRDGVVLLNTARSQLHDTYALVDELRQNRVATAGLDHFVSE
ncbi:hypothetical protein A8144_02605 [Mycobacterium leprae 3125609]|nr:hypothetical protein A8144_02605 [Mycobacterium leprae 3125609]OAX70365.1 hypothetical protein A3216_12380 [Mycobacterium leprae 7935681]